MFYYISVPGIIKSFIIRRLLALPSPIQGDIMRSTPLARSIACAVLVALFAFSAGVAFAEEDAEVDNSKTSQKLKTLKRKPGAKPVVAIYEFRSAVPEIQVKAAQEMFVTALIKSGAFTVAERQRLNEGVMREKQLNATGATTGTIASKKLAGASYIFEVVVSEANPGESQTEGGLSVGGMDLTHGSAKDGIGMDVRIVDAESGIVIDAVNVRKKIEATGSSMSGVGKLAQSIFALKGKSVPLNPDANVKSSRKESVDKALRSCIEAAVHELAKRIGED
jgi:curli biogenesis system outer membrane secretion channel CsgG